MKERKPLSRSGRILLGLLLLVLYVPISVFAGMFFGMLFLMILDFLGITLGGQREIIWAFGLVGAPIIIAFTVYGLFSLKHSHKGDSEKVNQANGG